MVGVAHSRACTECRRKRKRCDAQRPDCGLCTKLRRPCTYVNRPWTFVKGEKTSRNQETARPLVQVAGTSGTAWLGEPANRPVATTTIIDGVEDAFWRYFLPRDANVLEPEGITLFRSVCESTRQDRMVLSALRACAFTCLGRVRSDDTMIYRGTQLYGQTLTLINNAIGDPVKVRSDAILVACRLAVLYEVFRPDPSPVSPQASHWKAHLEGLCRLLEFRGVEALKTVVGNDLFRQVRMSAVRAAVTDRKPHSFSLAHWRTGPWQTRDLSLDEDLADLMLMLPELLQRQDHALQWLADHDVPVNHSQSILQSCRVLVDDIISYTEALKSLRRRGTLRCGRFHDLGHDGLSKTQPDWASLHNQNTVVTAMNYWTTCLIHFTQARLTVARLTLSFPGLLPLLPSDMDPQVYAAKITRTTSRLFTPEAGLWLSQQCLFPLGAVKFYYAAIGSTDCEEMRKLQVLIRGNERAQLFLPFLRSMAANARTVKMGIDVPYPWETTKMAKKWYGLRVKV